MTAAGLYIHIPFCVTKCPYCAFYSIPDAADALKKNYLAACLHEIRTLPDTTFDTIYIGGGTPSVLGAEMLAEFIRSVLAYITYTGTEFTVELNPESADKNLFSALQALPVNRVSIGVQSLDNRVLHKLGRAHSAEMAVSAFQLARNIMADAQLSVDMIYDIPGESFAVMNSTLEELIRLAPDHISAYSYSPDTGYLAENACDDPRQMEHVITTLEKHGYRQYEVSNFARFGYESKHNMKYWKMASYTGIGAGAHSLVNSGKLYMRYSHAPDVTAYMESPPRKTGLEVYPEEEIVRESIAFGLRMKEGINLFELEEKYGKLPDKLTEKLKNLTDSGLLTWEGQNVQVTKKGLFLLDSVMHYLW